MRRKSGGGSMVIQGEGSFGSEIQEDSDDIGDSAITKSDHKEHG